MRQHRVYTLFITRTLITSGAFLAFFTVSLPAAMAAWSSTIEGRKVLSAGNNYLVGNLLSDGDGGVIATVESQGADPGSKKLISPRYDIDGNMIWDGLSSFYGWGGTARRVDMYLNPDSSIDFTGVAGFSAKTIDDFTFTYQMQVSNANTSGTSLGGSATKAEFEAGVLDKDGLFCAATFNFLDRTVTGMTGVFSQAVPKTIAPGMAKDFSAVARRDSVGGALFSFTRYVDDPITPSEIYVYSMVTITDPPTISTPVKIEPQAGESQANSKLAAFGSNFMITWIGTLNGRNMLYTKAITNTGAAAGSVKQVMENVIDYVTAPSTFGVPLFAYVQQDNSVSPPTESLFAGLVDPISGLSLVLPVVTANGVKIKAVRQEPSGEVTLVYSVPTGTTNILKARRYSTAGAVLWECDVADLGTATDEKIKNFPNTFVAAGSGDALYFLTRRDTIGSVATEFSLARLRPDGKLGNETIPAPSNLAAITASPGNVSLQWDDNASNETSYVVVRLAANSSDVLILATLPADTESYTDATAVAGVQYYYIIAAQRIEAEDYSLSDLLPVYIAP